MRKHRKIKHNTDSNFFISQFKLTSTTREPKVRKLNTTFSTFKQHLKNEESKLLHRSQSKDKKPIIEQLNFNQYRQDFKLPLSTTKRSKSKNKDLNKLSKNIDENSLVEPVLDQLPKGDTKRSMGYLEHAIAQRKFKQKTVRNELIDKLEKTALEKFRNAVTKENEDSNATVDAKNAEALYKLLKNTRSSQDIGHEKSQEKQSTNDNTSKPQPQKVVPKPSQNSLKCINIPKPVVRQVVEQSPSIRVPKSIQNKPIETKKTIDRALEQSQERQPLKHIIKEETNLVKEQKKDINNLLSTPANEEFQRKSRKESFSQSMFSSIDDQALQISSIVAKQSTPKLQQPKPSVKQVKEKVKQPETAAFGNIPEVKTVQPAPIKAKQQKNVVMNQGSSSVLREQNIAKVLTTQNLQHKLQEASPSKTGTLSPPPKLNNNVKKDNKINYKPSDVQEDELQEVEIYKDSKKVSKSKDNTINPVNKQKSPQKNNTSLPKQKPKVQPSPLKNQEALQESPANQAQESQVSPLDELAFYIEKIQDIGQYRVNSKDLYSDKSISKDLVQAYQLCAYYMSHQFLYLSKMAYKILSSPTITTNFYNLTLEELEEIRIQGELQPQLQNLEKDIESSKKLLKKCYDQTKQYLPRQQQILLLEGNKNYYFKCCEFLIRQFKKIYALLQTKPQSQNIQKRCCYIIEMFCLVKMFNDQELKDPEELEDIRDKIAHIKAYKHLLVGN